MAGGCVYGGRQGECVCAGWVRPGVADGAGGEDLASTALGPGAIEEIRKDKGFERLIKLLAGYPLAMEVVLGNLARQRPQEILDGLNAADVDLDVGGEDRTNNILKCVEYSHGNLSGAAQKLLVCLAPFNSFVYRDGLKNYGKQLQQLAPFAEYDFGLFDGAVQEAIQWGLLSQMSADRPRLLSIQPIFPYFLRTKLNELNAATREALYDGFKAHYQGLAESYNQLMSSKDSNERQLGISFCRLEYENLQSSLKASLEKKERIDIFFCLYTYFRLTANKDSRLSLSKNVCEQLDEYPNDFLSGSEGYQVMGAFDLLAAAHLEHGQYADAEKAYKKELALLEKLTCYDAQKKGLSTARIEHQLGYVAEELREYEQARSHYQQALNIFIDCKDRYEQAGTYHQLGSVAQQLREYEQARSHFQQALDIFIGYNDRYSQASTYHSLGMVAQQLREYEQARSHYQQALDIKIDYKDRYSQASTYHQLGRVAQKLKEYEQARSHYQQALDIYTDCNDRYSQAGTYGQLGLLAEAQKDYAQAQQSLQKALEIFIEFNDQHSTAMAVRSLARLHQATQDDTLIADVAQCLNTTVEEVSQLFERLQE